MFNKKILTKTISTVMVLLFATLLVLPTNVLSANFVTEVVSTESGSDSDHPSLAVDLDGNVHVAWEDSSLYGAPYTSIFYKAKIGGSWTVREVVSTESVGYSAETSLAVDQDGNIHIVWRDGSGVVSDISYKTKIGGSWTATEVVSTESTEFSNYPSLAIGLDGNVHVAWTDGTDYNGAGTDDDIFYKAKIGGSWTAAEVVSTESDTLSSFPSLAVDNNGDIHIAWSDPSDYGGSGTDWDVFYKAKIGGSWTAAEVVSTESDSVSTIPSLAVDPDGNVHVAWGDATDYGGSGTDKDIFYKAKIDGSWTPTEVVSTESTDASTWSSLAVDPDGNIHVAWTDDTDYLGSGIDGDIFYKAKIGGSWTTTEVVSTESTDDSRWVSLAIDSNRYVHTAWEDDTDYGGSGVDTDIFYKIIVPPFSILDLMGMIIDNEAKIDDIEAKLDDPNTGLIPIKSEVDKIEGKLDILLERLGIVGGLMLPTDGLKLVIDLFINNAEAMILGILLLIGLPLLMRRIKKKS